MVLAQVLGAGEQLTSKKAANIYLNTGGQTK